LIKRSRNEPSPRASVQVRDHFKEPELAPIVDRFDELMSQWPIYRDQFGIEISQYRDADRAYEQLVEMYNIMSAVHQMLIRDEVKGVPGGGTEFGWQSQQPFVASRLTISRQVDALEKAQGSSDIQEVAKILGRFEKSAGTLRANLVTVMEFGYGKKADLVQEVEKKRGEEVGAQVHASLRDAVVGGEIYGDPVVAGEDGESPEDEEEGEAYRPYYEIIGEWREEDGFADLGRVNAPLDLRKFPSLHNDDTSVGVDVARYGEDRTVIVVVQSGHVVDIRTFPKVDTMETCGRVVQVIDEYAPGSVKIETTGGLGAAVYDRLKEMGYGAKTRLIPLEVQGAPKSDRLKPANLRAELYLNAEEMLRTGELSLPPDEETADELLHIRYEITSAGKIQICAKEKTKKDLGRSPDKADAVVMAAWRVPSPRIYV